MTKIIPHAARAMIPILAELKQFLLKWGLRIALIVQHIGDFPHFSVHADCSDNGSCGPVGNTTTTECHIGTVTIGAFSSTLASASFSVARIHRLKRILHTLNRHFARDDNRQGIKSPASRWMISPGTSRRDQERLPYRHEAREREVLTYSVGCFRAFSALLSCIIPIIAFKTTMRRISAGSKNSMGSCWVQAMAKEIAAADQNHDVLKLINERWKLVFFFLFFELVWTIGFARFRETWSVLSPECTLKGCNNLVFAFGNGCTCWVPFGMIPVPWPKYNNR